MNNNNSNNRSITIVIPNKNHGKYIYGCVNSIVKQSTLPNEIIIVDDGSDDDSVKIIKSLLIPELKFIQLTETIGTVGAINQALKLVSSEFVMFVSSNDVLHLNLIKEFQKDTFNLKIIPGIWSSCTEMYDPITNRTSRAKTPIISMKPSFIDGKEVVTKLHSLGNWITGSTAIYRTDIVKEVGGLDPSIMGLADYLLMQICASKGGAIFSPHVSSRVLIHSGYLDYTYQEKKIKELFLNSINRYKEKNSKLFTNNYINLLVSIINKNSKNKNYLILFLFIINNYKFIVKNIYYRYIKLYLYLYLYKLEKK